MKIIAGFFMLIMATHVLSDDTMITEAQEHIKKQLKDPYSAVFENSYIGRADNGAPVVCGTVNAKNSYGAYIGAKKFFYMRGRDRPVYDIEGGDIFLSVLYDVFCVENLSKENKDALK